MSVGDVSYFDYRGGFVDLEQRDRLRRALGPNNKVEIVFFLNKSNNALGLNVYNFLVDS